MRLILSYKKILFNYIHKILLPKNIIKKKIEYFQLD